MWVHDFELLALSTEAVEVDAVKPLFEEAFPAGGDGHIENDEFNRLVLRAGLAPTRCWCCAPTPSTCGRSASR